MYLEEMFEYIIIETGQFILGPDDLELDQNSFKKLVRIVLGEFNQYRPVSRVFSLEFGNNRFYDFNENFSPDGTTEIYGIPRKVTSVTPTEILGSPAYTAMFSGGYQYNFNQDSYNHNSAYSIPGQRQASSVAQEKSEFPWVYRKPRLWVPYSSRCEVKSIHNHEIVEEPGDGNTTTKFKIDTIGYEEVEFLEMLRGRFMMAVGSSRKSFTINELPVESDAESMYQDGRAVYADHREILIRDKSKFYEAYGD